MIQASQLVKRYPGELDALRGVSLNIDAGEMVFLGGRSGAGKTTLLRLLATLERPTSGVVVMNGVNLTSLRPSALPYVRRNIGLIFQDHKLLFDRNALANVLLPLDIAGVPRAEGIRRAHAALDKAGLHGREKAMPIALSGGEQQRLAIARAIVNRPALLLADEPTTSLDPESAAAIMDLFRDFHRVGTTILLTTHAAGWAERLGARQITLDNGRLQP